MTKMKQTRVILNIIAFLLLVYQILGYLATLKNPSTDAQGIYAVAYYLGFNFPILLAAILGIISLNIKRKIRKKEADSLIDSIGKK